MQAVFLASAISVTLISAHVSAQSSPQTLMAGVILQASEIDSSKVQVGAYKENKPMRIVGKLAGGILAGTLVGLAVGSVSEKAALARGAGADDIVLYTERDFETEVLSLTDGQGVEVVYDSVAKATYEKSINCLKPRGYMVFFGNASGPVPPIDPLLLSQKGSIYLTRPTLNSYTQTREEYLQRTREVMGWIQDGELDVRIGEEHPLENTAEAHNRLEGRQTTGKVLLIP